MSKKVSVVIPVWNPGRYLDRSVDSLLAQTMPSSDFEVLFMDDGSTDGTEHRLDRLAEQHPHFVVHHLENSGWPGKPRNVGIERAAGEYIQFMDNDDALGPEALERMYRIGARNNSDIVIGKVISDFRGVPHQVFRTTREQCDVRTAPLFESLTPHKMFRRRFMLDHDIRYPEGKRRLEDQLIMARAYFPAKNVSIVGDYVCYYYLKRDDGKNAGSTRIEPRGYYDNLREVLDVVVANTEPGDLRDSIMRRFYRGEMLGRVGPPSIGKYPTEYRDSLITEVRRLALEPRFDPAVYEGLPAMLRVRSRLLRDGRVDELLAAADEYAEVRAVGRLEDMKWDGGELLLAVRAWFTYRNRPMRLERKGAQRYLPSEVAVGLPLGDRECTGQPAEVLADVVIKNRETAEEFFLPATLLCREVRPVSSSVGVEWAGEARIDPSTAFGGRRLARGVWDVSVRLAGLGMSRTTRLGAKRAPAAERGRLPALVGTDELMVVIPYWTVPHGNLSIDIDQHGKTLGGAVTTKASRLRLSGGSRARRLTLAIPLLGDPGLSLHATVHLSRPGHSDRVELPTRLARDGSGITLTAELSAAGGRLRPGRWEVEVTAPQLGWSEPTRYGQALVVSRLGTVRVHGSGNATSRRSRYTAAGAARFARREASRVRARLRRH